MEFATLVELDVMEDQFGRDATQGRNQWFVMTAHDIPSFCTYLLRCDMNSSRTFVGARLSITINARQCGADQFYFRRRDTRDKRMLSNYSNIEKLLEPFRDCHVIPSIQIGGVMENEYKSFILAEMQKSRPTFGERVDRALRFLHTAEQALKAGQFDRAISALDATDQEASRFPHPQGIRGSSIVKHGSCAGKCFATVYCDIVFWVEFGFACLYLKLGWHGDARRWAMWNLALFNDESSGQGFSSRSSLPIGHERGGRGYPELLVKEMANLLFENFDVLPQSPDITLKLKDVIHRSVWDDRTMLGELKKVRKDLADKKGPKACSSDKKRIPSVECLRMWIMKGEEL